MPCAPDLRAAFTALFPVLVPALVAVVKALAALALFFASLNVSKALAALPRLAAAFKPVVAPLTAAPPGIAREANSGRTVIAADKDNTLLYSPLAALYSLKPPSSLFVLPPVASIPSVAAVCRT